MSPENRRGPVTPAEAIELQEQLIPDEVFVAFNGLIAQRLSEGRSTVYQDDVIDRLRQEGMSSEEIFEKHWLDVEASYRAAGWQVRYDKPAYNETGRAYFEFRAPSSEPKPGW